MNLKDLIEGLQVFQNYPDTANMDSDGGIVSFSDTAATVSAADAEKLKALGWEIDPWCNGWCYYTSKCMKK